MKKIVLQALATLELIVRRLKTEKKDAIAAQLRNIIIEIQTVEPDEEKDYLPVHLPQNNVANK